MCHPVWIHTEARVWLEVGWCRLCGWFHSVYENTMWGPAAIYHHPDSRLLLSLHSRCLSCSEHNELTNSGSDSAGPKVRESEKGKNSGYLFLFCSAVELTWTVNILYSSEKLKVIITHSEKTTLTLDDNWSDLSDFNKESKSLLL